MNQSLRVQALRWIAWTTLGRFGEEGLRLGSRLVLARLLWPEAFGLFTLAAVISGVFLICAQLQMASAIIQRPTVDRDLRATAHWSLTLLGVAGGLAQLGLAGPVSALVGEPRLAPLLAVLCLHVVLQGIAATPRAWLSRELAFRQLAGASMAAEGIATVAAVGAAVAGAGVYSLAVHMVLVGVSEVCLMWRLVPWRPHRHWRLDEFLALARFGSPLLAQRGVDYLTGQGDRFLVGYLFGPTPLGYYALALRLSAAVGDGVAVVFDRVAFPVFARTGGDLRRSRRGFLHALRAQSLLITPVAAGLAVTAPVVVPLALGADWAGAVLFVQLLAVRALLSSLSVLPRAVLLARGRRWRLLGLGLASVIVSGICWTAAIPWGPAGIAAASGMAAGLLLPVALPLMRDDLPITLAEWGRALLPAGVGLIALAAGVAAGGWVAAALGLAGTAAGTALVVVAGGLAYLLPVLPLIAREARFYRELFREDGRGAEGTATPSPTPGEAPSP